MWSRIQSVRICPISSGLATRPPSDEKILRGCLLWCVMAADLLVCSWYMERAFWCANSRLQLDNYEPRQTRSGEQAAVAGPVAQELAKVKASSHSLSISCLFFLSALCRLLFVLNIFSFEVIHNTNRYVCSLLGSSSMSGINTLLVDGTLTLSDLHRFVSVRFTPDLKKGKRRGSNRGEAINTNLADTPSNLPLGALNKLSAPDSL